MVCQVGPRVLSSIGAGSRSCANDDGVGRRRRQALYSETPPGSNGRRTGKPCMWFARAAVRLAVVSQA